VREAHPRAQLTALPRRSRLGRLPDSDSERVARVAHELSSGIQPSSASPGSGTLDEPFDAQRHVHELSATDLSAIALWRWVCAQRHVTDTLASLLVEQKGRPRAIIADGRWLISHLSLKRLSRRDIDEPTLGASSSLERDQIEFHIDRFLWEVGLDLPDQQIHDLRTNRLA
jgi:hypothetical protein